MVTHSAFLLVANVVLVQSSFGVQAEPEVTSRGRLRGSRPTVSNETALPTGAVGCEQAVEQVREAFALQTQCRPGNFTPLSCRRQVDAGINWWRVDYFAKVDVQPCGVHGFAHLHIYEGGPGLDVPAALDAVALDADRDAPVEYFASETSGAIQLQSWSDFLQANKLGARGHLRGNSTTVTTTAPAGINETAEADEDVPATLALDVEMNASLEYFGSQASEETLGGTIEEAGEETMATLGRTPCYRNNWKNSVLQQTFRSFQDCMNCCMRRTRSGGCSPVTPVKDIWKCYRVRS